MNKIHELKTWPFFYADIVSGKKPFELRYNDRDFKVGDTLLLLEYSEINALYTGEHTLREITYVLSDKRFGLQEGYVVLGLSPAPKTIEEIFNAAREEIFQDRFGKWKYETFEDYLNSKNNK